MSEDQHYGSLLSVKLHGTMRAELDRIALFEHRKLSELIREWLGDKIEGYSKRPDYRRFEKQLEERRQKRS